MRFHKLMLLIIVLMMLAGVATYIIFTSDLFESSEPMTSNIVNEIVVQ